MTVYTEIKPQDGYVLLVPIGTMQSTEEAQEYGERMFQAALDNGTSKILLDERRLKDEEDTYTAYEVSESDTLSEMREKGFRIALISNADNYEINQVWETMMQNRSINLKVFLDKTKALAWLMA